MKREWKPLIYKIGEVWFCESNIPYWNLGRGRTPYAAFTDRQYLLRTP